MKIFSEKCGHVIPAAKGLLNLLLVKKKSIKLPLTKNKNISLHLHTTNSGTVSNLKAHLVHLTKILSLTHRKCRSKPNI